MVSNPNIADHKARNQIDAVLTKLIKGKVDSINYLDMIREILLAYPVSKGSVVNFIQEFYIDAKVITKIDNELHKVK